MRIYESDGSYTDQPDDVEFGWFIFQDRPEDDQLGESMQDSVEEVKKPPPQNVQIFNPKIKMQPVQSVVLAGPAEGHHQKNLHPALGLGNIDSKVPSKQQVSNLITPWSAESKLLLSVVHYAKYEKVMGEEIDWDKKSDCPSFKFYVNNDTNSTLNDEIIDYNETKEANMMSLMMELILVDMKCDVTDVVKQPVDTSDLGNSIQSDNSLGQEADKAVEKSTMQRTEGVSRSEILNSIGLSDIIDRSIEKMCAETEDIHLQIAEIRNSFHTDEAKVNSLITEARKLEKNLRETRYLDELIHLLNGDLHKVAPKKWPFKIFLRPSDKNDINLIV